MTDHPRIASIYRYPVKGLSAEALQGTHLSVGGTLPCDRLYAIENGPSGFDVSAPSYLPKARFFMLMRHARLAELRSAFDEATHTLTIASEAREMVRADLATAQGRGAVERFFETYCASELRGPPKVLHAPSHSFSDIARKVVSIVNISTLAAIETAAGVPVHPLRFRANVYVAGWPVWREFALLGREIAFGANARLKIVKRIVRCAATEVDPDTGMRDLAIPQVLQKAFGHQDCGIYAEVIRHGTITVGDRVTTIEAETGATRDLFDAQF
jgi:uncharacterized protein